MKAKTYHISIGSVGPFNCRAASPRKAIEAHVPNPDEVSIIWKSNNTASMYRVEECTVCGMVATFIGYIRIVEEVVL